MIEKQSYQEPFSEVDKRKDDEMEIDLMAIFYKIIAPSLSYSSFNIY